jgi:hypothetical protein
MKKIFFAFSIILFVVNSTNAKPSYNNYPLDTMQQFIDNYGQDSLVKLIDERIDYATFIIRKNWSVLQLDQFSTPFLLASRHYDLGFDTLPYIDESNNIGFYFLYNQAYGDTLEPMNTIRYILYESKLQNKTLRQLVQTIDSVDYTNKHVVMPTAMLCHFFEADGFCGEVVYNYYTQNKNNLSEEEKVAFMLFIAMTIRADNFENYPKVLNNLKEAMNQVFKETNLARVYDSYEIKDDSAQLQNQPINDILKSVFLSLVMSNNMLYANLADSDWIKRDLFHLFNLFDLQLESFRFTEGRNANYQNFMLASQVLWNLLQWKDILEIKQK